MGSLAKLPLPRRTVTLGEGPDDHLAVRGLSAADISALMHAEGGEALSALYLKVTTDTNPQDVAALAASAVSELPALVARAIAIAADEPDEWPRAMDLPVSVSLDLLLAIGELTFGSDSPALKKLSGAAARFASPNRPPLSGNGSGASGLK